MTVWDVLWTDAAIPTLPPLSDALVVSLDDADCVKPAGVGAVRVVTGARYGAGAEPQRHRDIVVQPKGMVGPIPNTSSHPVAFPRPRAVKVAETHSAVAWDYTWLPGQPTPTHFHDKDVVVVYLADGDLLSVSPEGSRARNAHTFGYAKFNPGNRVHYELLGSGHARAIVIELQ
ncbi:MAG: hypothetical protein R2712_30025 [Vicinamibacterales bacterium]